MRNYRGKTKEGKWVYGFYAKKLCDYTTGKIKKQVQKDVIITLIVDNSIMSFEVLPETVGQFVLKENGVDRYEGDVFRVKLNKEKTINMAVVFVNHKYQLACKTEGGFYTLGLDYIGTEDVKHIGDLTDYPSLMEDTE